MPDKCPDCEGEWVFRAPWWAVDPTKPSVKRWGYVVHCEAGHFAWYEATLSEDELAAAMAIVERRAVGAAEAAAMLKE